MGSIKNNVLVIDNFLSTLLKLIGNILIFGIECRERFVSYIGSEMLINFVSIIPLNDYTIVPKISEILHRTI